MSCVAQTPTYRLLDAYLGWDHVRAENLEGFACPEGIRIHDPLRDRVPAEVLTSYLPPPWLAAGCDPCTWFLLGVPDQPVLFLHEPCAKTHWVALFGRLARGKELKRPVALTFQRGLLAIADAGQHQVYVWSVLDGRLVARFAVPQPGALVFAPWGDLLVTSDLTELRRFSIVGDPLPGKLRFSEAIRRLGRGKDGMVHAAVGAEAGPFKMWTIGWDQNIPSNESARACSWAPTLQEGEVDWQKSIAELPRTTLLRATEAGFCLNEPTLDDGAGQRCYGRDGKLLTTPPPEPPVDSTVREGKLETHWLDSGIPRCRWHRMRVYADIPVGASVDLWVVAEEEPPNTIDEARWERVALPDGILQKQFAGRYLRLRMMLRGTGQSPVVRRIRLDFPRASSLDRLPPVYRDNEVAEDFTERFLALFDASLDDLDAAIDTFSQLLDVHRSPREALGWLASLLGVRLDPSWDLTRCRALLLALPDLYARRGTPAGLKKAIGLLFDVDLAIEERGAQRFFAVVGRTRLRAGRLFSPRTNRFTLGQSILGEVPLHSTGDPHLDPVSATSHRFQVLIPRGSLASEDDLARLDRFIQAQKPAHAQHSLRQGGKGFQLEVAAAVGVDSHLGLPDAPVLGSRAASIPGTARLAGPVALRSRRRSGGVRVGELVVGATTLQE